MPKLSDAEIIRDFRCRFLRICSISVQLQENTGLFERRLLPHPTPGKKGISGDTPRPAKGRLPLGTLLPSTRHFRYATLL